MANNAVYAIGSPIPVVLTAAVKAGDPFVLGALNCVAMEDGAIGDTITAATSGAWTIGAADGLTAGATVKIAAGKAAAAGTDPVFGKLLTASAGGFAIVLVSN